MDYKDDGCGITVESLEFWDQHKPLIGEVTRIACSFRPLRVDVKLHNGYIIPLEYNLKIFGTRGTILLSGCSCGYGGEGPNGTRRILEELGVDHDRAMELIHQKRFATNIGGYDDNPLCLV